jgi:hypothetical protein
MTLRLGLGGLNFEPDTQGAPKRAAKKYRGLTSGPDGGEPNPR